MSTRLGVAASKRSRVNGVNADASPFLGPRNEHTECVLRFSGDLLRAPQEPATLSLNATSEDFTSPLSLRIAAPRALNAADFTFEVSQPWCHPFRLVRVAARAPVECELLESSDRSAALQGLIDNMRVSGTLEYPNSDAKLRTVGRGMLSPVARLSSDGPWHGPCVLIEIPVPAGITLYPGATISLTVSDAGSPITLRIPAAGHIHCATCNHAMADAGAVWRAACAGDAAAVEAALAAGGSTEEADGVRRQCIRTPSHSYHIAPLFSQGDTALVSASLQGHAEAVRILLAAGADVNAKWRVSLPHKFGVFL